jgi:seipin
MHTWWLLSFAVFTTTFWGVSMISTGIAWLLFSSYLDTSGSKSLGVIDKEDDSVQVKAESNDELTETPPDDFPRNQHGFSGILRHIPTKSRQYAQSEERTPEGKVDEPPDSDSFSSEASETSLKDEGENILPTEPAIDSGFGTGLGSPSSGEVQRRRSHRFSDHER